MISIKRTFLFFTLATISIATISLDSFAQKRRTSNSKSDSTPSASCLACIEGFSSDELVFTTNEKNCPTIVSKCPQPKLTPKCEQSINECIKWNCTTSASCTDEMANRSLFYGCLKAENQFMPYQCASYIKGYASSVASEQKAAAQTEQLANQRELEKQKLAQAQAEAAAAEAQAQAEVQAKQIEAEAQIKAKQIEAQAAADLEQKKYELEQQAKLDELTRQAKLEEQRKNSKPSVKYNNLLSAVKKDLATAKTHSNKAYNLLGIQKTTNEPTEGNIMFFPPQIIKINAIIAGTDAKSKSLKNGSKYKDAANFVCTKDTKESFIKTELNNLYKTIQKTKTDLSTGISELEALNADDETIGAISEDKITTLYQTQNKLTEILNSVEIDLNSLTTSCETRCAGMQSMSMTPTTSGGIEFDENGLIVEQSSSTGDEYSCKDFETSTDGGFDMMAMMTGGTPDMSSMMGGIGQKATELTKRVTKAVLNADKALDEAEIAIQSGIFEIENIAPYGAIDTCAQFIGRDISTYTGCIQNVLSQQILALSLDKTNTSIMKDLNKTLSTTLVTMKTPSFKNIQSQTIYCQEGEGQLISSASTINLTTYNNFEKCILSITEILSQMKGMNEKTGNSAVNISYISPTSGDNNIVTSIGETMDATYFAKEKLNWEDTVSDCKIQKPTMTDANGNQVFVEYTQFRLECNCIPSGTRNLSVQQINMGAAGNQCLPSQQSSNYD